MTVNVPATARSRRTRVALAAATHQDVGRTGIVNPDLIAELAGVSTATFYSHFASHDDALAAALDLSLTSIVSVAEDCFHIEAMIGDGLDPTVTELIKGTYSVFRDESLVMRAALTRIPHHRPTRDLYRKHEARTLSHLKRQIELGQKAGLLRSGPPERRSIALLVLLQGLHNPLLTKKRLDPAIATDLHRSVLAAIAI